MNGCYVKTLNQLLNKSAALRNLLYHGRTIDP
jgi:hypothetical protein